MAMKIDISDLVYAVNGAACGLSIILVLSSIVVGVFIHSAANKIADVLEKFDVSEVHVKFDEEE